jgi:hypothetical protein
MQMEPLATQKPPRPLLRSRKVFRLAAKSLLEEIQNKWKETIPFPEEFVKVVSEKLFDTSDGSHLAMLLENRFEIKPDFRLVTILEGASWHINRAYQEILREWVKEFGINTDLEEGTPCRIRRDFGEIRGIVQDVFPDTGQYLIMSDGYRQGEGIPGFIANVEEVEKI